MLSQEHAKVLALCALGGVWVLIIGYWVYANLKRP